MKVQPVINGIMLKQTLNNMLLLCVISCLFLTLPGCVVVRYVDSKLPAPRLDRPSNKPLPDAGDTDVVEALHRWQTQLALAEQYPTAYHHYVKTKAAGSYEKDPLIGLAFSGGGSRGVLFSAACIAEFRALGALHIESDGKEWHLDLLQEVDYVSGVSTGAIPAALYVLDQGGRCPEGLGVDLWPEGLNLNPIYRGARVLPFRPDWIMRDFIFDMNTRPAFSTALAATYFEGSPFLPASGLTFGDLPPTPVLLIGSALINDPGAEFIFTRLPYRYALNLNSNIPWSVDVQTFETFRSDPMRYPLGEACYNSLAYPGVARSGLLKVMEEQPWVLEGLDAEQTQRMIRARTQEGYSGVYELKDGGLIDNRGIGMIGRLFENIREEYPDRGIPLLIGIDAGYHVLRPPGAGGNVLNYGWFQEMTASFRTNWQAGQSAKHRLIEAQEALGFYDLVRFRYTAWLEHMPSSDHADLTPEQQMLLQFCAEEPLVQTPENLLEITLGIGTSFTHLSAVEMAAIKVTARFAVMLARHEVLDWAKARYGNAWFTSDQ